MNAFELSVGKFPARSPAEILRKLASSHETLSGEEILSPVSIFTQEGLCFRGFFLKVESSEGAECLLLRGETDSGRPSEELTYFLLNRVVAVTVHDPRSIARTLSWGEIPRALNEEAPSALDLRRQIVDLSEKISKELNRKISIDVDWELIPKSGVSFLNLRDVCEEFYRQIQEAAKVPDIRAAWQWVLKIAVVQAERSSLQISREASSLVFQIDLNKALPERLAAAFSEGLNRIL
jgi:hypothetical protein